MTFAGSARGQTVLRAKQLTKVFGPHPERALALLDKGCDKQEIMARTQCSVAVRGISFEIFSGELFVIMGLSGSGKSTVIRLLNRLIEPTRGSVELDGRDINALGRRELRQVRNQRLSMVFQHFAIFPHRSVRENISYGLHVRGTSAAEQHERADRALQQVGLRGWEDAHPAELSGGMKQRVGLARALATDAEVMLMDEPFSALDPLTRRDMQDLLISLYREFGRTIVFVTHDLNEAMRLGQRVMIMREGAIIEIGTGARILSSPSSDYVSNFISDVDRTRVLTAKDVMRPQPLVPRLSDVPSEVLSRLASAKTKALYVVENGTIAGLVSVDALRSASERGVSRVADTLSNATYRTTRPETSLVELCALVRDGDVPLAVVDGHGVFLGTIDAVEVLAAIGGNRHDAQD
jgi:glycine betaine/proline transport system ATP-binding protein